MIDVIQIGKRRNYLVPRVINEFGLLNVLVTDYTGINDLKKRFLLEFKNSIISDVRPIYDISNVEYISPHFSYYFQRVFSYKKEKMDMAHMSYVENFLNGYINRNKNAKNDIYAFNGAAEEVFLYFNSNFKILDMTSLMPLDEYSRLVDAYENYGLLESDKYEQNYSSVKKLHDKQVREILLADKVICLSSDVKYSILKYLKSAEKKIEIIHHSVELNRRRESYNHKVKKILFLGRVSIDKGFHLLLEFIRRNPDLNIEIDFVGPNKIKSEIISSMPNNCRFIGSLPSDKVKKILPTYDLTVFPSIVGGLGMACYESLSFGVPILTSENEFIDDNYNSFLFKSGCVDSFCNKLQNVLNISPTKMDIISQRAYELASKRSFSNYISEFKRVVNCE